MQWYPQYLTYVYIQQYLGESATSVNFHESQNITQYRAKCSPKTSENEQWRSLLLYACQKPSNETSSSKRESLEELKISSNQNISTRYSTTSNSLEPLTGWKKMVVLASRQLQKWLFKVKWEWIRKNPRNSLISLRKNSVQLLLFRNSTIKRMFFLLTTPTEVVSFYRLISEAGNQQTNEPALARS